MIKNRESAARSIPYLFSASRLEYQKGMSRRIESLCATAHDPKEDLAHLSLQQIEPVLHGVADLRQLFRPLAQLLLLAFRHREGAGLHQLRHLLRAPLDLKDLLQKPRRVLPLPLLRLLHDPIVEVRDGRRPWEGSGDGEVDLEAAVLAGDRRHHG